MGSHTRTNGRAAAIECYLDLRLKDRPPAQVTLPNCKAPMWVYRGALDLKESYKAFHSVSREAVALGSSSGMPGYSCALSSARLVVHVVM